MLKLRKRTFGELSPESSTMMGTVATAAPSCPSPPLAFSSFGGFQQHQQQQQSSATQPSSLSSLSSSTTTGTALSPFFSSEQPFKRVRTMNDSMMTGSSSSSLPQQRRLRESHFPPLVENLPQIDLESVSSSNNRKKGATQLTPQHHHHHHQQQQQQQQQQPQQQPQQQEGRLYTEDEVRDIVMKTVQLREQQLRREYDAILTTKLQEQFANFAQFNQDYISRQFKQSDFSYTS